MHSSPSRQTSGDDEEAEGVEEDSDGEGLADDVSSPDVPVLSVSVAVGVGEAVVPVVVSVASDMVETACESAEAVTAVRGTGTLLGRITCVAGVARGAAAACLRGSLAVEARAPDEVRSARCGAIGVDESGVESVT